MVVLAAIHEVHSVQFRKWCMELRARVPLHGPSFQTGWQWLAPSEAGVVWNWKCKSRDVRLESHHLQCVKHSTSCGQQLPVETTGADYWLWALSILRVKDTPAVDSFRKLAMAPVWKANKISWPATLWLLVCLQVKGMEAQEEWVYWADENLLTNTGDSGGLHPTLRRSSYPHTYTKLFYCYYTPEGRKLCSCSLLCTFFFVVHNLAFQHGKTKMVHSMQH